MDQFRIPCVIMRAGTSKGIFLKENDLPAPGPERDKVVLNIFGSPDKRQIDGLAGADPLTSKLASPAGTNGQAKRNISFCSWKSKRKGLWPLSSLHHTGVSKSSEAKEAKILAHKMA